jgi:hypothetical protein
LKNCVEKCNVDGVKLQWAILESICTDGAASMVGKRNGCVFYLGEYLEKKLFSYHYIIHKKALCAKYIDFNHVISPVVHWFNMIRSCALNRREIREIVKKKSMNMVNFYYTTQLDGIPREKWFNISSY